MNKESKITYKSCFINICSLISDAIVSLEKTGMQICIVVSDKNELLGTITDGDIRRGLLEGYTVESKAKEIMSSRPMVVNNDMTLSEALKLMRLNLIRHLPVVDDKNVVVNLHMLDQITPVEKKENVVVIMAGGFGKRLAPHTDDCPKPMLLVNDKPMLEHIIDRAISEGFQNFIISVFYLADAIKNYFGDGSKWGINIEYIKEDSPLGTAGALSIISPIPSEPIIVTNGDVITRIKYNDILNFHIKKGGNATMAIRQHEWQNPFGIVNINGIKIESFKEKPIYKSHINAGVYVLDPEMLNLLNQDEICDMPMLFQRVNASGNIAIAYPMHESWVDVGRPEDLVGINKKSLE